MQQEFTIPLPLGNDHTLQCHPDFGNFLTAQIPILLNKRVQGKTINHILRSENLLPGTIAEFGVGCGKSINLLAKKLINKTIYVFDSFVGLPDAWNVPILHVDFKKGAFSTKGKLPKVRSNVILKKGLFRDTLPEFIQHSSAPFSLLHIDCDLYSSTKTVLDLLHDRIVPGTIIIFDEFFAYQDEAKAFYEFIARYNECVAMLVKDLRPPWCKSTPIARQLISRDRPRHAQLRYLRITSYRVLK